MKTIRAVYLLSAIMVWNILFAQGQDIIQLKNGDELHGEIKNLNKSILTIETDYSDIDFSIDWDEVSKINSTRNFNIFLSSREKVFGTIRYSDKEGYARVSGDEFPEQEMELDRIVMANPIKDSFKDRFTASISAGLTLTKANNAKQFSLRTSSSYIAKNWKVSGYYNQVNDIQDEAATIRRMDAGANFNYLFYKNWFGAIHADFLSNTEQEIELRSTQTLAIGNLLVRSNKLYLSGSGGISFNREDYLNEENVLHSEEAFFGVEFNAYDIGDLSFLTKLGYYRSLTEDNRNRVNLSTDVKYEFPYDLFIKVGYTLNFDSKPPNEGSRDDYVFQTTFGWEF